MNIYTPLVKKTQIKKGNADREGYTTKQKFRARVRGWGCMALEILKSEDVKTIERTGLYRSIRKDLHQQLEMNGTVGDHYKDLLDDYMRLYVTKCLLDKDIKERGVIIEYNNGGGQTGTRKNDAVDMFNKVNTQMMNILNKLGLEPSQVGGEDDDL